MVQVQQVSNTPFPCSIWKKPILKNTKMKVDNVVKVRMQVQNVHHILHPHSTSDDGMMPRRDDIGASKISNASTVLVT